MATADVRVITVEPHRIAAVRMRTTLANLGKTIRQGLNQVWPDIIERSGLNVVLYHPSEPTGLGHEFEIETGVQVAPGFVAKPPVYLTATPGGRVVTAAHFGPYEQLKNTYDAIDAYVRGHGLKLAGPSWEVYGHWHDDVAKVRTDVFFPIA